LISETSCWGKEINLGVKAATRCGAAQPRFGEDMVAIERAQAGIACATHEPIIGVARDLDELRDPANPEDVRAASVFG
jgi:hypothetical protein